MLMEHQVKLQLKEREDVDRRHMYETVREFGRIVDLNMTDLAENGIAIATFTTKTAVSKLLAHRRF